MDKEFVKELTNIEEDFAKWYTDIVLKAELADYTDTKGCIAIKPYGYAIWENIQKYTDDLFKKAGVKNVYFPVLIPESLLQKEKDHVEGFAPEVAMVTEAGGEPLEEQNQKGLLPLVKKVKEKFPNKNIWCYTGFDFEKDVVGKMAKENDTTEELLKYLDVVVDGKFEEEKKDLKLRFRGSSNQRILNVQESLKEHKLVECVI